MAQKNASCLPPKFREDNVPHLADLSDTNRANLAQNDDDFEPHTWENLIEIIGAFPLHLGDWLIIREIWSGVDLP